jgi:hypothetical protein
MMVLSVPPVNKIDAPTSARVVAFGRRFAQKALFTKIRLELKSFLSMGQGACLRPVLRLPVRSPQNTEEIFHFWSLI